MRWLKIKVRNSVSPKIKEPPEKNLCVCESSTKIVSPVRYLHMLFPVYIRPWFAVIAANGNWKTSSMPSCLIYQRRRLFSTRQVHLSRWPSQPTLGITADKECHLGVFVKPSSAAGRRPPARHRGIAKQTPSYRHCEEGFSIPQFSCVGTAHFAIILLSCSVNPLLCLTGFMSKWSWG